MYSLNACTFVTCLLNVIDSARISWYRPSLIYTIDNMFCGIDLHQPQCSIDSILFVSLIIFLLDGKSIFVYRSFKLSVFMCNSMHFVLFASTARMWISGHILYTVGLLYTLGLENGLTKRRRADGTGYA